MKERVCEITEIICCQKKDLKIVIRGITYDLYSIDISKMELDPPLKPDEKHKIIKMRMEIEHGNWNKKPDM